MLAALSSITSIPHVLCVLFRFSFYQAIQVKRGLEEMKREKEVLIAEILQELGIRYESKPDVKSNRQVSRIYMASDDVYMHSIIA